MSASPTAYPHSNTPWKTISIGSSAVERRDWHWAHPKPWSGQFDLTLECTDCWLWFYMRVGCFCSLGKTWVSHSVTRFCKSPGSSCRLQRLGAYKYCRSHPEVEHWSIKTEIFSDRIAVAHRFLSNADAQVKFAWWPAVRQKKKVSDNCFFGTCLFQTKCNDRTSCCDIVAHKIEGGPRLAYCPETSAPLASWRKQHGLTLKAGNIHGTHRWANTAVGYICFFVVERCWRCKTFKGPPKHGELQNPTPGTDPELDSQVTLRYEWHWNRPWSPLARLHVPWHGCAPRTQTEWCKCLAMFQTFESPRAQKRTGSSKEEPHQFC